MTDDVKQNTIWEVERKKHGTLMFLWHEGEKKFVDFGSKMVRHTGGW